MVRFRSQVFLWLATGLYLAGGWQSVWGADHLDAPVLRALGQGGRDINDVYAFQSPANPSNSVLILTVNPFAGLLNPFGTTSATTFDPTVEYQFLIDNNANSVADVTYSTTFTAPVAGVQTLTTTRNGVPVATGVTGGNLPVAGGGLINADLFDDPFFFDLVGFNNGFAFGSGVDTFAGANVSAIVLEVPSADLQGANSNIGVWARTLVGGNQVDRMGRPAINTALIPAAQKDAFNAGIPADDPTNFGPTVQASIQGLNGNDVGHATGLKNILLPDILTFDTSNPAGFLNGRGLTDDVIDAELGLLTQGAVTTDSVGANDVPFRSSFPYLGVPEPGGLTYILVALGLAVRRKQNRVPGVESCAGQR